MASAGNKIVLSFTALAGTNKVGDLQVDKDGYYEVVLGALNAYNSYNAYYPYEDAEALFRKDADLLRRVALGRLRGESGHPRPLPGMSQQEWFGRVSDIYEPNTCVHHGEVALSMDTLKDAQGRPLIAIMGKARPSGPHERSLERQLDNPKENVCFSVRSFTSDEYVSGRLIKRLRKIVTWDNVNEPGIAQADKFSVPSLESHKAEGIHGIMMPPEGVQLVDPSAAEVGASMEFSEGVLQRIAAQKNVNGVGLGMESATQTAQELIVQLSVDKPIKVFVPRNWNW